jgi:nitrogen fixation/metabolism regulation signal transduction histidine kinase
MGHRKLAMNTLKQLSKSPLPYLALGGLLLVLTILLSTATQDSSRLNDLFLPIFGLGLLTLLLLIGLLFRSLLRLYRDFKTKKSGSKLTVRLVSLFVLLILISTTIVYSFSVHFLHRGINSWFDVEIEQALDNSLAFSRTAFGDRKRTLLRQTRMMSGVLSEVPVSEFNTNLRDLTDLSGAIELSVWTMDGQLVTSSLQNHNIIVPDKPNEAIFRQLKQKEDYIGLDPSDNDQLQLRAAVLIPKTGRGKDEKVLHVLFPVNEQLSELGKTVQDAYTNYKELNYLRKPLISIFTLTLSLIVLLTVLASIWFAIWISRRIVQPLQALADGTQSVASGNYNTQLTSKGDDEIGFLVRSFNQMTQRLTRARDATQVSHRLLEQQTNYLGAVLGSLSSGVITLDEQLLLKTANVASSTILETNLQPHLEMPFSKLEQQHRHLQSFIQMITTEISHKISWSQQIELHAGLQLQSLMCRGTPLSNNAGWVIVFDDITTLIQAQRDAAWGEVARRLAHEIKNPLTPIQLSAERLQIKYLPLVPEDQTEQLNKLTNTIIQQVDAMKDMVNDFSDYAKSPSLKLEPISLTAFIHEVIGLYQSHSKHKITLSAPVELIVTIDSNRFRQVLHNLLKNSIEASEEAKLPVIIDISYRQVADKVKNWLELTIRDSGPGIPDAMMTTLFEPYATSKVRGTGLGLAIVKKIIDEHQGNVWTENIDPLGACIIIRLPLEKTTP